MTQCVAFDDVHVAYPGSSTETLRGITLSIPFAQHVCILGGNGSGKSTLLQLVNALIVPTKGDVRICGTSTRRPDAALSIRACAACVFQHPQDQMVTSIVADDVAFGPENLCVAQPQIVHRVDAALASVCMGSHAQSDPADLSGGQVQSVAIAGALAMEPQIMLLDEPCAMLDMEGRGRVRKTIAKLRARGITILHVTHFMEDALGADRVIVLDDGRVAFDGTPGDLFSQPDLVRSARLEMPDVDQGAKEDRILEATHGDMRAGVPPDARGASAAARAVHSSGAFDESRGGGHAPALVEFDRVCFSHAAAANPRKRTRSGRFLDLRKGAHGARAADRPSARAQATGPAQAGTWPLALDSLSFSMSPGTLTALIGRTGSGKTTAAELACALKLPISGAVHVAGIDTSDLARRHELRRKIGYVAQLPERQLFAETVFEDVAFGPRNLGLPAGEVERRVREALASVGLEPTDILLSSSPFSLSGGQQRSVALAGVLAMKQPILVLDEPMAGLDPAARAQIRSLLRGLKRSGTTLLMVTHSMRDVAELADQVVVLDHGRRVDAPAPAPARSELGEVGPHGDAR